ncbi:MAG: DUF1540 domain-containing protein [Clostridia bacterium]|nr:DUF1540 domain-containing protein [Clostridia bacterium]
MPNLSCTVERCTHNKNNLCCLKNIKVGTTSATNRCETECDSFSQKDDIVKKFVSSVESPVTDISINCSAKECTYNNDHMCTATNVHICGDSCCTCSDTQCDTFKCCE